MGRRRRATAMAAGRAAGFGAGQRSQPARSPIPREGAQGGSKVWSRCIHDRIARAQPSKHTHVPGERPAAVLEPQREAGCAQSARAQQQRDLRAALARVHCGRGAHPKRNASGRRARVDAREWIGARRVKKGEKRVAIGARVGT